MMFVLLIYIYAIGTQALHDVCRKTISGTSDIQDEYNRVVNLHVSLIVFFVLVRYTTRLINKQF